MKSPLIRLFMEELNIHGQLLEEVKVMLKMIMSQVENSKLSMLKAQLSISL